MPSKGFSLNWKGDIVVQLAEEALGEIVADLGLAAEAGARLELYSGHGVLSGDLRRSTHLATPGHVFAGETGSADLAGNRVMPQQVGAGQFSLVLGSGVVYAMAIHQGWPHGYPGLRGSFAGYHFLTRGVERMRPQITPTILRHRIR